MIHTLLSTALLLFACKPTKHGGTNSSAQAGLAPSDPAACTAFYDKAGDAPPVDSSTLTLSAVEVTPAQIVEGSSLSLPQIMVKANPNADLTYYKLCNSNLPKESGCIDGLVLMPMATQPGFYGTYIYTMPATAAMYDVTAAACVRADRVSTQGPGAQVIHPTQYPDLELFCGPNFSVPIPYSQPAFPDSMLAQKLQTLDAQNVVVNQALYALLNAAQSYGASADAAQNQVAGLAALLAQDREGAFPLLKSSLLEKALQAAAQTTEAGTASSADPSAGLNLAGSGASPCVTNAQVVQAVLNAPALTSNGLALAGSAPSSAPATTSLPSGTPGDVTLGDAVEMVIQVTGDGSGATSSSDSPAADASTDTGGDASTDMGGGDELSKGDIVLLASLLGGTAAVAILGAAVFIKIKAARSRISAAEIAKYKGLNGQVGKLPGNGAGLSPAKQKAVGEAYRNVHAEIADPAYSKGYRERLILETNLLPTIAEPHPAPGATLEARARVATLQVPSSNELKLAVAELQGEAIRAGHAEFARDLGKLQRGTINLQRVEAITALAPENFKSHVSAFHAEVRLHFKLVDASASTPTSPQAFLQKFSALSDAFQAASLQYQMDLTDLSTYLATVAPSKL